MTGTIRQEEVSVHVYIHIVSLRTAVLVILQPPEIHLQTPQSGKRPAHHHGVQQSHPQEQGIWGEKSGVGVSENFGKRAKSITAQPPGGRTHDLQREAAICPRAESAHPGGKILCAAPARSRRKLLHRRQLQTKGISFKGTEQISRSSALPAPCSGRIFPGGSVRKKPVLPVFPSFPEGSLALHSTQADHIPHFPASGAGSPNRPRQSRSRGS